ncbi:MAG: SO_0444 family Cu/Zn efflux transporter [Candidatus Zixiibacteriota bacterium]
MHLILKILLSTWELLREAGPFMLAGFLLAGAVRALLPSGAVVRFLGKSSVGSVLRAAIIGVPLPLCSCGVVPLAASLRREGASKGAVSSFVISTPESGADSIAATYALMDLPMTLARPVIAFVTAIAAGLAEVVFGRRAPEAAPTPEENGGCGCNANAEAESAGDKPAGFRGRAVAGLRYAFVEMFEDMAPYLLIGFLAAGILAALVPPAFVAEKLPSSTLQILAMVVLGAPIYVCATAATPVAAVLVAKGVSPGAALAFLLAGPATNAASLAVLTKYLGRRSIIIYLGTILVCAVAGGVALNAFYDGFGLAPKAAAAAGGGGDHTGIFGTGAAALFLALCLNGLRLKYFKKRGAGT